MMRPPRLPKLMAIGLLVVAAYPTLARRWESARVARRLDALTRAADRGDLAAESPAETAPSASAVDPALLVRVEQLGTLLAGWQTIGGCGAGSGSGSGIGVKWIGRSVTGGSFNIQEQVSYTRLGGGAYPEHNFFASTLLTKDINDKWTIGVNVPFVYKYLVDPLHLGQPGFPGTNVSNAGLGDISFLWTRKLGRINATSLTGLVGVPTGTWDAKYTTTVLNQSQQLGFGKPTASLILDHTMDQIWGLVVLGAVGSWRGGHNVIDNERVPSATTYAYAGYFLGQFVPAFGLSLTGFKGHDLDKTSVQYTGLASLAANVSVEWSTDWLALLAGASIPYQYDGIYRDDNQARRSPWGFGPWTVSLGVAASPF